MNFIWIPTVSIIVAAYNEELHIANRLQNIMSLDYPEEKLEIIVSSDGSTDRTVTIARTFIGVKVIELINNQGKATAHNKAVREAKNEIIIFTDAESEFEGDFLLQTVRGFQDEKVGCVVGNLNYNINNSAMAVSESIFWRFEKRLRKLETDLGIMATASGACMAVRKILWQELDPTDDSDFATPLDVILQGYRVVFAQDAIAYDVPASTIRGEFWTRVRQTSRNLVGTLRHWGLRGCLQHPLVSLGLLSHKILRWCTPFFLVLLFISNLALLERGLLYRVLFTGQLAFYAMAMLGLMCELTQKRIVLVSTILSFCVACAGMGVGVIKGVLGYSQPAFRKVGKS